MWNILRKLGINRGLHYNPENSHGLCVCPNCGYCIKHDIGNPCRVLKCPTCNVPLMREREIIRNNNINTNDLNVIKMEYPKVNAALCTGCGSCVDVCPVEAISMVEGKAVIDTSVCANCRVCESECPVGAIS